ncbi:hypothetical protein [Allopusillimonas ginsengisoli]|uniref:hypothetical protein n=1 Tax=Allopusillimonas ginsengisoli TaxID=453575 RepID=UPI001FD638AA|nr:hypothetical protein [Allopusillimonas ginsengisoli]
MRTSLAIVLLLSGGSSLASSPPTWPVSPSRMELSTPYGTLHVNASEYVYESRLFIDNTEVTPAIRGILNITYAFKRPKALVALVSIDNGSSDCPVVYRWIILDKAGYTVSPEFGSCSENIKVSATGQLLTLRTPSSQKPDKIDIYTYDGKTVRRSTTPK